MIIRNVGFMMDFIQIDAINDDFYSKVKKLPSPLQPGDTVSVGGGKAVIDGVLFLRNETVYLIKGRWTSFNKISRV